MSAIFISTRSHPETGGPPSPVRRPRISASNLVALPVLLVAVNLAGAPEDFGWFALNPTPYLIIPVLLGVRGGWRAGVLGGLVIVLALLLGRHVLSQEFGMPGGLFTLVSYPLVGALVGRVADGLRKRRFLLVRDNTELAEENSRLQAERELMLLSRQNLRDRHDGVGTGLPSFEEGLDDLPGTTGKPAPAQLLATLKRLTRVRAAAVYVVPEGGPAAPLTRVASIGEISKFPEHLYRHDHQIVEEALAGGKFLIQKTMLEAIPSRGPGYLGAYPIVAVGPGTTFLLVVQDLPFNEVRSNTFEVMKSICDWMKFALAAPLRRRAQHRAVNQCEFFGAIERAVAAHKQQAIPSALVRLPFDLPAGVDPTPVFRELLKSLPRKAVLSNSNEEGQRALLFLFPGVSDPDLLRSMRCTFTSFGAKLDQGEECAPVFFTTNPGETPQQMWGRLVAVSQDLASQ